VPGYSPQVLRFPDIYPWSWPWSYGSWIYNYLCNQCLSPLMLWVGIPLMRGVLDTILCDKVCQWLATGRWFSPGTPVSSTNKTDHHNVSEILLKVVLNTITWRLKCNALELDNILKKSNFCFANFQMFLSHKNMRNVEIAYPKWFINQESTKCPNMTSLVSTVRLWLNNLLQIILPTWKPMYLKRILTSVLISH
jgi:hypothetical protein